MNIKYLIYKTNKTDMFTLQVAMTTMCGVFMNLVILEETLITSSPISNQLLTFLLKNVPTFGENTRDLMSSLFDKAI